MCDRVELLFFPLLLLLPLLCSRPPCHDYLCKKTKKDEKKQKKRTKEKKVFSHAKKKKIFSLLPSL